jgi:hypothetical protein
MSIESLRISFKDRFQANYLQDLDMGLQNLLLHKLRSLLTMLGMIFGVAAVIAMLSIGAGARQQAMAFIEQLGVRNLIVEAKESVSWDDLQKVRKTSKGLTMQDYRVISASATNTIESTPRKRFVPSKILPKPSSDLPVVFGVNPNYQKSAVGCRKIFQRRRSAARRALGSAWRGGEDSHLRSGREYWQIYKGE